MGKKVKIYVMPKVQFQDLINRNEIDDSSVDEFIKYAFICIDDTSGEYFSNPLFSLEHHNVLKLSFDDVEEDLQISPTNKEMTKAFTDNDGKRVIRFLESNKNVNILIIHCAAGISRSGAIGTFALDYLKGDKEFFKLTNPHILPNGKVLKILNKLNRNLDNVLNE